jgi:xylulose-5-phosphate/fructose-6-phosphate phosphoketolase
MENSTVQSIEKYVRAANYLTACQIYLQDNVLLTRPLTFDDIKPRLLGHWGTCPGINFIYAHLNYFIKKHNLSTLFVLGPGHGFAALQANLFLEGTLEHYYPDATQTETGIQYLCKNFSWPYGFPSHTFPGTPGSILEGGELGYALSTAYGAALDNPDLLVACVIGDGEAETGPTAAAWHLPKLINPAENGIVLPILHLNGYKISGPTIFGRMTNKELKSLFYGYGYQPFIVEGSNIYQKMITTLDNCYSLIQTIKHQDRVKPIFMHLPMIILKTPKGWTGIKRFNNKKIEGNNLSHQVVLPNVKTNRKELHAVEKWLRSYNFSELFNPQAGFDKDLLSIIPSSNLCMGNNKHAYSGKIYQELSLPDPHEFAEDAQKPGTIGSSSMRRAGLYLRAACERNQKQRNFRFFSPDEIYSNKLDAILACSPRSFMLPIKPWDQDLSPHGRVIELLSEHTLQGLAQGYILTGRHAVFASYEAFIEIISSMASQYAKFLKVSQEFPWRGDCAGLTYILTSSGWRQEHNGFSHQNPGFIGTMLEKYCDFIKAYFPPDGNSTLVVLKHCLASKNAINIITAGKTLEPRWLTVELAQKELDQELMIWDFASDANPDIIFAAVGDYLTKEALAAIDILKTILPTVRIRFVNIMVLSGFGICASRLSTSEFETYFTQDKPVIFNYHGYPETLKALLFNQKNTARFTVYGYIENGSTTTPFDMHVRNNTSRYHLVIRAAQVLSERNVITSENANQIIKTYQQKLRDHCDYIKKYGVDPKEIEEWQWQRKNI